MEECRKRKTNCYDMFITCRTFSNYFYLLLFIISLSVEPRKGEKLPFFNVPLTGIIDEGYSVSIDIGSPAQRVSYNFDLFSNRKSALFFYEIKKFVKNRELK